MLSSLIFLNGVFVLNSKKSGSRKTGSKNTSRRSTKKKAGLFKKKTIKPKVKLDQNKVMGLCAAIIVFCAVLIVAAMLVPDSSIPLRQTDGKTPSTVVEKNSTLNQKNNGRDSDKKGGDRSSEKSCGKNDSKKRDESRGQSKEAEKKKAEEQKKREEQKKLDEQKRAEEKKREEEKRREQEKLEEQKKAEEQKKNEFADIPPAVNKAQLVFVLDDGGQNLNHLEKFLKLPMPLTIAVLPGLQHSAQAAAKIRAAGKEVILHQPMQALNAAVNPGPGAIKPEMTDEQVLSTLFKNIDEIGPIAGMNNHEGSAITADEHKMEVILKFASENGIYFLDSRTNKDTKVPYVSKALGYSYYERNGLFLDNVKTRENALTEMKKNIAKANKDGVVIMIGHVWSADFLPELLSDIYPVLKQKGYVITTVSNCKGKK